MIFFVADMFAEQYEGGAELTTEAIISSSYFPCNKILSSDPRLLSMMKKNQSAFWIFGNFSNAPDQCLFYAIKNLDYAVLEYDYKFCLLRSPGKHSIENETCMCEDTRNGKLVSLFLNSSKLNYWMSRKQFDYYKEKFPFLDNDKNVILSSVFSKEKLDYICSLDTSKKNDKYLILNSSSWIKGVSDAIDYAWANDLKYELVWGLSHKELLKKLSESKGIIFLPKAGDTCPRMTIEAKLLDCDLILNSNVQHKDEPWFKTKENTLNYLRHRTEIFWSGIERIASKNLNLPTLEETDESTKFLFVVPFYNCEKWIAKCIKSIRRQNHENFNCVLIDDMSTDNSVKVIEELIRDDGRFTLHKNTEKHFALGNIVKTISAEKLDKDDVIILLDGDDYLPSKKVLTKLNEVYKKGTLLTYGSYVYDPTGRPGVEPSPYPDSVIKNNAFRQDKWRASHLRTFKYHLWKNLNLNDLKDDNNKYFEMTYDQAIMLPLLEMSSERSEYIPQILCTYNKQNPLNVDKIKAKKQSDLAVKIRNKNPYKRI